MGIIRRKSRQRDRILELVQGSPDHPTAPWIYEMLREEFQTVSRGNVYRNIGILEEAGLIAAREFGDGIVHYDAVITPHYHFICNKCGAITDFALPVRDIIAKLARKETKKTITGHTIQFFGLCEKCRKQGGDAMKRK